MLLVHGDGAEAAAVAESLAKLGHVVSARASSRRSAVGAAARRRPDVALVDLGLPGDADGVEAATALTSGFGVPVVYLTDGTAGGLLDRALASRPAGFVVKPPDERQLHLTILTAVRTPERDATEGGGRPGRPEHRTEELRSRVRLLEAVFEGIDDGVIVADRDGRHLMSNARAKLLFGDGHVEMDRRPGEYGIFDTDGKTRFRAERMPLARALRGEEAEDVEAFVRHAGVPDGVHILASAKPMRVHGDDQPRAVVTFRDITVLKRTEERLVHAVRDLKAEQRFMESVLDGIHDGVFVTDATGRLTYRNSRAEEIVGLGVSEVPPEEWPRRYGIFSVADTNTHLPFDELPISRAISEGETTTNVEAFIRNENRPDGVYISGSARPVMGHDGEVVVAAVGIIRDITHHKAKENELRKAMEELREQNELMEATFDSISDGIVVANQNGEFLYVNPAASRIVGMGPTEAPQEEWAETYGTFYPDRETPMETEDLPLIRAIFQGESTDDVDVFVRNATKPEGVFIRVSGRPLRNPVGGIRGGVIIFRNVTEKMVAEEALAQAFAQGRMEMVDTVVHNIGNAITSVTTGIDTIHANLADGRLLGRLSGLASALEDHRGEWAEYLREDPQGRQVLPFIIGLAEDFRRQSRKHIETIARVRSRARHIAEIVRTQRRGIHSPATARKEIVLGQAIRSAINVLQATMVKRGIEVAIDCEGAPKEIRIEESQFHQMLVNLLKNSVEAIDDRRAAGLPGEPPSIRIRAYADGDFVNLDVTDTGIGIEREHLKPVFAAGFSTKEFGSGLGLHSVANFVIGGGGRIEALSDGVGHGATMRVRLRRSVVTPRREVRQTA